MWLDATSVCILRCSLVIIIDSLCFWHRTKLYLGYLNLMLYTEQRTMLNPYTRHTSEEKCIVGWRHLACRRELAESDQSFRAWCESNVRRRFASLFVWNGLYTLNTCKTKGPQIHWHRGHEMNWHEIMHWLTWISGKVLVLLTMPVCQAKPSSQMPQLSAAEQLVMKNASVGHF